MKNKTKTATKYPEPISIQMIGGAHGEGPTFSWTSNKKVGEEFSVNGLMKISAWSWKKVGKKFENTLKLIPEQVHMKYTLTLDGTRMPEVDTSWPEAAIQAVTNQAQEISAIKAQMDVIVASRDHNEAAYQREVSILQEKVFKAHEATEAIKRTSLAYIKAL